MHSPVLLAGQIVTSLKSETHLMNLVLLSWPNFSSYKNPQSHDKLVGIQLKCHSWVNFADLQAGENPPITFTPRPIAINKKFIHIEEELNHPFSAR